MWYPYVNYIYGIYIYIWAYILRSWSLTKILNKLSDICNTWYVTSFLEYYYPYIVKYESLFRSRDNFPMWRVLFLSSYLLNMGKIRHGYCVSWLEGVLSAEFPLKSGFTLLYKQGLVTATHCTSVILTLHGLRWIIAIIAWLFLK